MRRVPPGKSPSPGERYAGDDAAAADGGESGVRGGAGSIESENRNNQG
jgi:hypothetical protein